MRLAIVALLLVLLGLIPDACATVQQRDSFTLNGEQGWIEEHPLGPVIEKRKLEFQARSTANYSGYTASWRIADGRLYLTEFTGNVRGREKPLKWLFPKAKGEVFADWFTGILHLNLGKIRLRKIAGHVVATDRLVVLDVQNGVVQKQTTFKYPRNIAIINARESAAWGKKIDLRKIDY